MSREHEVEESDRKKVSRREMLTVGGGSHFAGGPNTPDSGCPRGQFVLRSLRQLDLQNVTRR